MELTLAKWSVDDYHRMIDTGLLDHRHVELIEGEIVERVPEGSDHIYSGETLAEKFRRWFQDRAYVREARPITLENSEPEPDVAIAQGTRKNYTKRHPYPEDLLLVVEVSKSTLRYDLKQKRDLYARANIAEYWVVDLVGKQLHVFRQSNGQQYTEKFIVTEGAIAPPSFP